MATVKDVTANGVDKATPVAAVVEEVEVKVSDVASSAASAATPIVDTLRRLLLASIGAVAMTYDEAVHFVSKLVERGELAQKDGEKLLREIQSRMTGSTSEQTEKVEKSVEGGIEAVLNRLNIPSKRDIDELSAKIAQLSARVEELRKAQK